MSSLIAAQLAYRGACKKIQVGRMPWAACVVALAVTYGLFGLFMSFAIVLMSGEIELGWTLSRTLLKLGVLTATMAIILTAWLALPAVVILAFWLDRSNKALQTTQPNCTPER